MKRKKSLPSMNAVYLTRKEIAAARFKARESLCLLQFYSQVNCSTTLHPYSLSCFFFF